MKEKYNIEVAGIRLKLMSEDPKEYIDKLTSYIDDRIEEMTVKSNRCNRYEAVVFCAINYLDAKLKDELIMSELRDEIAELKEQLAASVKISRIDISQGLEQITESKLVEKLINELEGLKKENEMLKAENDDYREIFGKIAADRNEVNAEA